VGRLVTWDWNGSDNQIKLLSSFEVDVRETGGSWGYGIYPIQIGKQQSYSPITEVAVQCRVRTVDVYGNRSAWAEASASNTATETVLLDGSRELKADWDLGTDRKITVGETVLKNKVTAPRADLEFIGAGISGNPNAATVYVAKGTGEGTPSIEDHHVVVVQSNDSASGASLAVIGGHDNVTSIMLGRASKIDMTRWDYDQETQLFSWIVNDMLSLVATYDLSMSAYGLTAISMSAIGHLSACGRFQAGIGENATRFTEHGHQTMEGTATVWEDLRFPAQGINPPGQVSDPDIDTDGTLLFDKAGTELVAGVAQLPHSWKEGSAVSAHVHWCPTDADTGDVKWQLEYSVASINGVFPGDTTISVLDTAAGTAETHQMAVFSDISLTGHTISCIMKWKLSRIGGDDDYNADARLLEFDIHYEIDSIGSREVSSK